MNEGSKLTPQIANYNDKNLSTYIDYDQESVNQNNFIKRVISEDGYHGCPQKDPQDSHLHLFKAPQALIYSITTFGGPGSKYIDINEDSYFFGVNQNTSIISGVIDGSGGSESGYLGGKVANQSLSQELLNGKSIKKAFAVADASVLIHAEGGYAAGVAVEIDPSLKVRFGAKGDAKLLTIRNEKILEAGTSLIQSIVAQGILQGKLPPHAIHTHDKKHIIYSLIGDRSLPLFESKFQGKTGDTLILGSDGLWDVVSDYEIQNLATLYKGKVLQETLYSLAYQRNNSKKPFIIHFSQREKYIIPPRFPLGNKRRGDNITIQVIEIL